MKRMILGITAAIALAAPAHADSDDDNYLRILHAHDITNTQGDAGLIAFGHKVCSMLGEGYSMTALEDVGDMHEANGIQDDDVKILVKAAAATYCPEYIR